MGAASCSAAVAEQFRVAVVESENLLGFGSFLFAAHLFWVPAGSSFYSVLFSAFPVCRLGWGWNALCVSVSPVPVGDVLASAPFDVQVEHVADLLRDVAALDRLTASDGLPLPVVYDDARFRVESWVPSCAVLVAAGPESSRLLLLRGSTPPSALFAAALALPGLSGDDLQRLASSELVWESRAFGRFFVRAAASPVALAEALHRAPFSRRTAERGLSWLQVEPLMSGAAPLVRVGWLVAGVSFSLPYFVLERFLVSASRLSQEQLECLETLLRDAVLGRSGSALPSSMLALSARLDGFVSAAAAL